MAAMGISQSSSLAPDSSKAKSAAASVFAILDRKSKIDPSNDYGMTLENLKGNIKLQHVSFHYPTRPDIQIFQDLCLTIPSGKVKHYWELLVHAHTNVLPTVESKSLNHAIESRFLINILTVVSN